MTERLNPLGGKGPEPVPPAYFENALRWVAVSSDDDNTCEPCRSNNGKLYRNRQAAYRDYPGGKGYVKCVGAEHGNDCRCKVVKRGKAENEGAPVDIGEIVSRYRALTNGPDADRHRAGMPPRVPCPVNLVARAVDPQNADAAAGADLYLYDAIGGWYGVEPMDVVRALADVTGPLTVHINSPGGGIFDGAAIYDAIRSYGATKGTVTARIEGVAASAASFIALAADVVETTELGVMMVHDGMASAWMANQDDLMELADLVGMLSDNIAGVYARKTGGAAGEWRDTMRGGDTWFNADAQIEAKLADRIVGAAPPAPNPKPEPDDGPEPEPAPEPDNRRTPPIDVAGLRDALEGAFS